MRDLNDLLDPCYQEETNRRKRCELFAIRQAGFKLEEFKFYCREALRENPLHPFPFQKNLLEYLHKKNLKIVVVSSSIKWLVEIAVQSCSFPVDEVLGVETRVEEGLISSELIRPAPIGSFKGEVLLKHNQGKNIVFGGRQQLF